MHFVNLLCKSMDKCSLGFYCAKLLTHEVWKLIVQEYGLMHFDNLLCGSMDK